MVAMDNNKSTFSSVHIATTMNNKILNIEVFVYSIIVLMLTMVLYFNLKHLKVCTI